MPTSFRWTTFDLNSSLPPGWRDDVRGAAETAEIRDFPRTPVISRESPDVKAITRGRVHADQVRGQLPWLYKAYRNELLELAAEFWPSEHVSAASDYRYGIVLNVQRGTSMRFECHVDSNPITGLLFCTDHAAGGELVVANREDAEGVEEIERDCTVIQPHAGHLIFFDGRNHAHFARPLTQESETRIVAIMNFYRSSYSEDTRPQELNRHIFGDAEAT